MNERVAKVFGVTDLAAYLRSTGRYRLAWIVMENIDIAEQLVAVPRPCHLTVCNWDIPNWQGDPVVLLDSNGNLAELKQWADEQWDWWWMWYSNLCEQVQCIIRIYLNIKEPLTRDTILAQGRDWIKAKNLIKLLNYRFHLEGIISWEEIRQAAVFGQLDEVIEKYDKKSKELMARWEALPLEVREAYRGDQSEPLNDFFLEDWLIVVTPKNGDFYINDAGEVFKCRGDFSTLFGFRQVPNQVAKAIIDTEIINASELTIGHTVVQDSLKTVIEVKADGMVKLSDGSWYVFTPGSAVRVLRRDTSA